MARVRPGLEVNKSEMDVMRKNDAKETLYVRIAVHNSAGVAGSDGIVLVACRWRLLRLRSARRRRTRSSAPSAATAAGTRPRVASACRWELV